MSREIVGCVIVFILAVGPLALGLRLPLLSWSAVGIVLAAFLLWVPDVLRRRAWRGSVLMTLAIGMALIAYQVVALLNARSAFDTSRGQLVRQPSVAWLPSVADAADALPGAACIAAALAIVTMVADLGRSFRWRSRFVAALAFGGVCTALLGLLQETPILADLRVAIQALPWSDAHPFGLLTYHNNAATVMNLAIPAIAILALRGSTRRRVLASVAICVVAAAATANISRAGLLLAAAVAFVSLAILWTRSIAGMRPVHLLKPLAVGVASLGLLAGIVVVAQPQIFARLTNLHERWATYYPRYIQAKGGVELFERAPVFGHGVAGYRLLINSTSIGNLYLAPKHRPGEPVTSNNTAANDYLQTLVEWGVVGGIGWAALLVGGLGSAGVALVRSPGAMCRRELALVLTAMFAIFAHALVDSPLQVPALQFAAATLVGLVWSARVWRGHPVDPIAAFFR